MRGLYAARLQNGLAGRQLVIVPNQRRRWNYFGTADRQPVIGKLEIYAPLGLANRWLIELWPDGWAADGVPKEPPSVLTVEGSQYILTRILREAPLRDAFAPLGMADSRLAIEIIHAANRIAAAGLSLEEAAQRMLEAYPDRDDGRYTALVAAIRAYHGYLREHGFLDYSMALMLFEQLVTKGSALQRVASSYDWVLCDGYDEWPAVMQRFALELARAGIEVQIFGDPEGGHSDFENAEPEGFLAIGDSQSSASPLLTGVRTGSPVETGLVVGTVEVNYAHELWRCAGEIALECFARYPGRIAISAPWVDQVNLAFLQRAIPTDVSFQRISAGRRIVDQPMARAILALTLICHPSWLIETPGELPLSLNLDDLSALWAYTCNLDPVRGAILSRHVLPHAPELPPGDARLVERIGALAVEAYERLRAWVAEYRNADVLPVSEFVRRAFGELIAAGRLPSPDSVAADRLARTAERFERTFQELVADPGRGYCALLREGAIGAQFLPDLQTRDHEIVLGSTFALALSDLQWDALILLDLSSHSWVAGTDKPLFDSQVLSAYWPGGVMTEEFQRSLSEERAFRLLANLIRRTRRKAVLMASELDVLGFEQNGEMFERVSEVLAQEPAVTAV